MTLDYHRQPLRVTELERGWRVEHAGRTVDDPHLDRALARTLGMAPGSTFGQRRCPATAARMATQAAGTSIASRPATHLTSQRWTISAAVASAYV
ncbi:MAG TPA: hypothetical protein VES79_06970 [Solirubrobacteraceae bacterium]|nr:hypothetical protein [Solirubrobacteraceae bacterium]